MLNTIEILRSICFTKDEMANITNLGDSFSELEIDFMVEFKKIYELGTTQLKKFIDKLDSEGKDLDTYSILYYTEILNNGPLGVYVREYSKDKKYFSPTPDSIGVLGNKSYSTTNNTLYTDSPYQVGCSVDVYNRLPAFMQVGLQNAVSETENIFRSSLYSSMIIDNTLPLVDKSPQTRYDEESKGLWTHKSNGVYMVKDSNYYWFIDQISEQIFEIVKQELGDENFRVYKDKKQYNAFSDKNESTAIVNEIKKNVIDGDVTQEESLDLLGDVFDSEERRAKVLKVTSGSKDIEYALNTVKGQLGS